MELRNAFLTKSAIVHGEKYDYSHVSYVNNKTKVTIVCGVHGAFEQSPQQHTAQKQGCRECGMLTAAVKKSANYTRSDQAGVRYTKQDLLERANAVHGNRYDYTETEHSKMSSKVTIICACHGPFEQTMLAHIYKQRGCPLCGGTTKLTRDIFISKAHAKHDGKYDYTDTVYKTVESAVSIRCPIHGLFEQKASKHLLGRGCASCAKSLSSRKAEDWLAYMSFKTGHAVQRAWLGGERVLRFDDGKVAKLDGFDVIDNTAYEFHGRFHHGHPDFYPADKVHPLFKRTNKTYGDVYQSTVAREQKIVGAGVRLVVMWEHDWDRIVKAVILIQRAWRKMLVYSNSVAPRQPTQSTTSATSGVTIAQPFTSKWRDAWMARKEVARQACKERYLKNRDDIIQKARERWLADPEFRRKRIEQVRSRYNNNREEIKRVTAERRRQQLIADPRKREEINLKSAERRRQQLIADPEKRERLRQYQIAYKAKKKLLGVGAATQR